MEKIINVYLVGDAYEYLDFLKFNFAIVNKIERADLIIFTGGEDVDPKYYGEEKHSTTWSNPKRDAYEKQIFDLIRPDQIVVGICRGSQFLCVMNGGKLVQDVTHHAIYGEHEIINKDGKIFKITSTHHQMQFPYRIPDTDYDLLYWSKRSRSEHYEGIKDLEGIELNMIQSKEPEIVLYHKTNYPKCLAIQGHPEIMSIDAPIVEEINNIIKKLLNY